MSRIIPSELKDIVQTKTKKLSISKYIEEIDSELELGNLIIPILLPKHLHLLLSEEIKTHYILEGFKCMWIDEIGENRLIRSVSKDKVRMCIIFFID